MDDDVFELVELSTGSIALKRPGDVESLITVDIGPDIEKRLNLDRLEFVRVMLQAGFSEAADKQDELEAIAEHDEDYVHEAVLH